MASENTKWDMKVPTIYKLEMKKFELLVHGVKDILKLIKDEKTWQKSIEKFEDIDIRARRKEPQEIKKKKVKKKKVVVDDERILVSDYVSLDSDSYRDGGFVDNCSVPVRSTGSQYDFFSRIRFKIGSYPVSVNSKYNLIRISTNLFDLAESFPDGTASKLFCSMASMFNSFKVVDISYNFFVENKDSDTALTVFHGFSPVIMDTYDFMFETSLFDRRVLTCPGKECFKFRKRESVPGHFRVSHDEFVADTSFEMGSSGYKSESCKMLYAYICTMWEGDTPRTCGKLVGEVTVGAYFYNCPVVLPRVDKLNSVFVSGSFFLKNDRRDNWYRERVRPHGMLLSADCRVPPALNVDGVLYSREMIEKLKSEIQKAKKYRDDFMERTKNEDF